MVSALQTRLHFFFDWTLILPALALALLDALVEERHRLVEVQARIDVARPGRVRRRATWRKII